jgi:hypothetical protein
MPSLTPKRKVARWNRAGGTIFSLRTHIRTQIERETVPFGPVCADRSEAVVFVVARNSAT